MGFTLQQVADRVNIGRTTLAHSSNSNPNRMIQIRPWYNQRAHSLHSLPLRSSLWEPVELSNEKKKLFRQHATQCRLSRRRQVQTHVCGGAAVHGETHYTKRTGQPKKYFTFTEDWKQIRMPSFHLHFIKDTGGLDSGWSLCVGFV